MTALCRDAERPPIKCFRHIRQSFNLSVILLFPPVQYWAYVSGTDAKSLCDRTPCRTAYQPPRLGRQHTCWNGIVRRDRIFPCSRRNPLDRNSQRPSEHSIGIISPCLVIAGGAAARIVSESCSLELPSCHMHCRAWRAPAITESRWRSASCWQRASKTSSRKGG